MKPGNILRAAAIAAIAVAGSMTIAPTTASAEPWWVQSGGEQGPPAGYRQSERKYGGQRARNRNRIERRVRNRNRVERRERRRNRAERRARRHDFSYQRKRHGRRYSKRRHGFTHYYNGFWYSAPFWTYGYYDYAPSYSYGVSDWELHVEWCHNRYRSYNEDRDAYKGYDGLWHRCISPYS
jgi:hypothetical protein